MRSLFTSQFGGFHLISVLVVKSYRLLMNARLLCLRCDMRPGVIRYTVLNNGSCFRCSALQARVPSQVVPSEAFSQIFPTGSGRNARCSFCRSNTTPPPRILEPSSFTFTLTSAWDGPPHQ